MRGVYITRSIDNWRNRVRTRSMCNEVYRCPLTLIWWASASSRVSLQVQVRVRSKGKGQGPDRGSLAFPLASIPDLDLQTNHRWCRGPTFCAGEFAKHLLLHYGLLVNNNHLIVKRGANFVDATWQWCNDIYSLSATPSRWNNVLLGKRKELYDHGVGILFVLQLLCILLCSREAGEKRSGLVWACQCIFQGSY